ncbi:pentapeptide repeat-containing protein, partial [Salmonella sp. s51228]|uniref:pentapeptide repeat-containing protein n=1 Tax=Salmonella sp. s51228 TaxID=3159652 RepID=UPI00397FEE9A
FKDLRGLLFKKLNFEGKVDFEHSNLTDATFDECVFSKSCIFDACEMSNTKFVKCSGLENVSFIGSKIIPEDSFDNDTLDKLKQLQLI